MTIKGKEEYQWNQSWANPIAHTDVVAVVKELKEIQEVRGEITPAFVLESAKNKKSVLHGYFTWDNDKAAEKWRLQQASVLLRRIEVKVVKNGEQVVMRAFEITKRDNLNSSPRFASFDASNSNSNRVKQIASEDLSRIINRLSPFEEYKVVISWLKKTAALLSTIDPKDSIETKQEQPALAG